LTFKEDSRCAARIVTTCRWWLVVKAGAPTRSRGQPTSLAGLLLRRSLRRFLSLDALVDLMAALALIGIAAYLIRRAWEKKSND